MSRINCCGIPAQDLFAEVNTHLQYPPHPINPSHRSFPLTVVPFQPRRTFIIRVHSETVPPKSFKTSDDFRVWLERNHDKSSELMMRLFKVHARHRGIGYREALDEALCFGWIDGVRRALDEDSFVQRFTPRKTKSNWSAVNVKRFKELEAEGRLHPAGLAAFRAWDGRKAPYSFEAKPTELDAAFVKRFKAEPKAWTFYESQPPGYRRIAAFWIMSAKRPETRASRFAILLDCSARGKRISLLAPRKETRAGG